MPEVSVVIVCMGGPQKYLEACLAGLRAHTSASYEVLVVAYRWEEADKEAFAKAHPEVTLIPSDEVRGFSENNNLALPLAKGRYCLVLNDDTRMEEPVVDKLLDDLAVLPENAAVVSPCIRFADGRIQTCGRSRWTAWRYAKHYLHLVDEGNVRSPEDSVSLRSTPAPCAWIKRRQQAPGRTRDFAAAKSSREKRPRGIIGGSAPSNLGQAPGHPTPPTPPLTSSSVFQTYTLNGACFLIKTEVFRKVGWFDERFFFTPEDIALGHVLNEAGYTVWADPAVSITHLAGGSVSAMEAAIKPARVRGSLLFYGEPLWLRCFVWCFEALRVCKYAFLPRTPRNVLMSRTARNVMKTAFSKASPKELFIRFSHE